MTLPSKRLLMSMSLVTGPQFSRSISLQRWRYCGGFTLIELLVVMLLMALAASLVGPASVRLVEKMQAQAEVKDLQQHIRAWSYQAYHKDQASNLVFEGSTITQSNTDVWSSKTSKNYAVSDAGDSNVRRVRFAHILFPQQQIQLNSNGYPYPEQLIFEVQGVKQELNLFRLVEATE